MYFLAYNIIITTITFFAAPLLFFLFRGLMDENFKERLGLLNPIKIPPTENKLRIWIHAVSVGEVKVARAIVNEVEKRGGDFLLVLSTTTKTGRQEALREMPAGVVIIYNPFDLYWCVKGSLKRISPDIFINLETEIWPNFMWACRRYNIPAFLVNGRISSKSVEKYRYLRFLLKNVLSIYELLSMISSLDAKRIISIGANPDRVVVGGNAKYDLIFNEARPELSKKMAKLYKINRGRTVFVAGSTMEGEEQIIIDTYKNLLAEYRDMVLILAPRHIDRCRKIESLLNFHNLDYYFRSELKDDLKGSSNAHVIIIDVFGELFGVYSLGSVIFCGGSLVPRGGHNVIEAAIWGKPVIYGPFMENFLDAKELLERAGAGFEIKDCDDMTKNARWILEHQKECYKIGVQVREDIKTSKGSAEKQVENVFRHFNAK